MFGRNNGFKLFNILGFKVSADWSWLVIAFLLSWSLATGYFPAVLNTNGSGAFLGLGILSALMLFFSVVLHEVGHSYVARHYGIRILGIRLFIFGGVAQMDREPQSPQVELKVALAGPAVSAILASVFFVFSQLPIASLAAVSFFLAQANLAMVIFNMIPGFPMDGGRVLRAIVWQRKNDYHAATKLATDIGRYVAFGFMGLGGMMMLGGGFGNGLWLILIGMFLHQAARSNQIYAEYSRRQIPHFDWLQREYDEVDERLDTHRKPGNDVKIHYKIFDRNGRIIDQIK